MPFGAIVSLRKRNCRSLILIGSFAEVDGGEHRIGYAYRLEIDRLADIGFLCRRDTRRLRQRTP